MAMALLKGVSVVSSKITEVSQVTGNLVVAPKNRVAAVGQSVQLSCSTDDIYSVSWLHIPLGSRTPKDVYISKTVVSPYHQRFTVHTFQRIIEKRSLGNSITSYNLHITDIRTEDAGTYRCVDRTGMGEQQSAELTVLGPLPNCTSNIGPNGFVFENDCRHPIDEIHASCSIEYLGNIVPEMQWTMTSGQNTIQPQPITNVSKNKVSSVLNIMATESMDGASVIWYSTQSTQMKWTSAPIKTLYVKHNLSPLILSERGNVTCAANISRDCSYTWFVKTDPDNELKTVEGRTLEVSKPGTYLCYAYCQLHHTQCTVLAKHVEYRNGDEYRKDSLVIGLVIVSVFLVVVVVAMVIMAIYILKLRKKQKWASGTPSSSNSGSSQSGSDGIEPCINENLNNISNNSSVPPACEIERQVDDGLC